MHKQKQLLIQKKYILNIYLIVDIYFIIIFQVLYKFVLGSRTKRMSNVRNDSIKLS